MNAKAVPQGAGKTRHGISLGLVAVVVGLITGLVLVGPATAASPVKNGQIRACYKVKGKAKGAMRVVKGKRCKRGERPLTWSVAGPAGATGAAGSQGSPGTQGAQGVPGNPGANGSAGSTGGAGTSMANLETKVASLSLEVDALESLLAGVGSGDLAGLLAKLNGITGTQLQDAVDTVPVVSSLAGKLDGISGEDLEDVVSDLPTLQSTVSGLSSTVTGLDSTVTGLTTKTGELCTQAKELNEQSGLLGAAFGEIKVLSGLVTLGLPTIDGLDPFACTP